VDTEPVTPAEAELIKGADCPVPVSWGLLFLLLLVVGLSGPANAIDVARVRNQGGEPISPGKLQSSSAQKVPADTRKGVRGKRAQKSSSSRALGAARSLGKASASVRTARRAKSTTSRRLAVIAPVDKTLPSAGALACREKIEAAIQPARTVKLAEDCARELPNEPLIEEIRSIALGARRAMEVQRSVGLSAEIFEDPYGDAGFYDLIRKSARGDADAAYRIAQTYKVGQSGILASTRRMEQWLRFSAELGNGRASWELAELYNYEGLVADAARFEKKAQELGYQPGVRLPSRGY
jgi:hypothetical protein